MELIYGVLFVLGCAGIVFLYATYKARKQINDTERHFNNLETLFSMESEEERQWHKRYKEERGKDEKRNNA